MASGPAGHGAAPTAHGPAGHGPVPTAHGPAGHAYAPGSGGPVHGSAQAHPGAAGHGSASDASGYGPATVAGNPRVTDAQRARLEGRSPIIEPGIQPAALTALLGLLLSGTAAVGSYALLVPLVVLQAVTAAGWFRLNGMWPARQGIALAFLGALVADAALLAAGRENAPAAILGTLGVWVLLSLVMQLRSHADPDERMYGLMATVASAALAIVATGHLAADPDAVTVGAAAVAVAVLARALPLPTPASVVVSLLAAAGAGIAVGGMTGLGAKGAFLGAGAAVCALVGHRVASYDYPSRFVHFTAGVALPLAAAAPAVYVLGRAIG
ncbi:Peptidase C83 domain-containing protein OS=Streptomyces canus OX=58343 GN=AQJ46_19600 PE=4 SV=1 [Streptomyces canus]